MANRCALVLLLPSLGLLPGCGCGPLPEGPDAGEPDAGEDAGVVVVPVASVRLFFTDLQSGPNSGGEGDLGAFVTLYGRGFGAAQGGSTVTVGGGAVAGYPVWSDSKVTVQLGAAAVSGEVVVAVPGLGASNGVRFTVRPGELYFVATSGNDTAVGSRAQPWRTLVKARQALSPGDIAYVMSGVATGAVDAHGAAVAVMSSGSAGRPKALVAYPGARPVIGRVGGAPETGLRTPNIAGGPFSHWVIAGFKLQGVEAMSVSNGADDWRVVGNELTCPLGNGATGCFSSSGATNLKFLGNEVHGAGMNGASKLYHSVSFSTDSNHLEVGWNHVHDNSSCRGIQFHSSPLCVPSCGAGDTTGFNQFDLSVHDNRVHGQVCDGISFATVDPSKGKVEAYNNVIWDVGRGPDPPDGPAGSAGLYVAGATNSGPAGSGTVELFNNTLYDCGARGGGGAGAMGVGAGSPVRVRLRNNIASARTGEGYLTGGSPADRLEGSNNLWFGAGAGPSFLTGNVEGDPGFANPATGDFHLAPGSAAVNAGVPTGAVLDFDGVARPQGGEFDLGAFEAAP